jgi:hypothetical protein
MYQLVRKLQQPETLSCFKQHATWADTQAAAAGMLHPELPFIGDELLRDRSGSTRPSDQTVSLLDCDTGFR